MKRNYFVFLLMLLAIFSLALPAYAKKIKFGEHIVYNGKVEGETPAGEGKLVITHPNNKKTESAICIGTFDGWIIQGSIEFYAKNALPSFTGKAELSVSEYGTSVIYKLIEGVYKDEMHADGIQITEKRPLLITSKIGADIELSSSEIVLTEQVSYAKYADFSPLNIRTITNSLGGGQEPKFYKHSTCQISVDKVLHEVKYHETADFGNDMTAIINGESISFTFKNGDYYIYKSKQITPISFKKHYTVYTLIEKCTTF